jgi:hypothetical protein
MKMSVPKSMHRAMSIVCEISGGVLPHDPPDSCINSMITSDDAKVSLEMTHDSGSDWPLRGFLPPHFLSSALRARFNTHRHNMGAAV